MAGLSRNVGVVRAPVFGIVGLLFAAGVLIVFAGDSMALQRRSRWRSSASRAWSPSRSSSWRSEAEDAEREASQPEPPPEPDPHAGEAARRSRPRPPRRPS